ncbi:hypothetical protein SUGI_0997160 [Cryptomeria japonica]|nr:hypothetical protein SUGI_0997160 [Cryptomeria japonica]
MFAIETWEAWLGVVLRNVVPFTEVEVRIFVYNSCSNGLHSRGRLCFKNLERTRITNSYVSSLSKASYKAYNYTQVLNHFGYTLESYQTFPQRYFIDKSNWGGAQSDSPIFVWLGSVVDITHGLDTGIFLDQAPNFKALVVYIEHRYYGMSMPFGGKEAAYANASTTGYFPSTQALADYATIGELFSRRVW